MHYIATTRFNNLTWSENKQWKSENNWNGCIYNTPTELPVNIPYQALIFIIEMNNDKNKIMGIGLIRNRRCVDQYYKVYKSEYKSLNYNRFTYKSNYYLSRNELTASEECIIKVLDIFLFTTKKHLKRGQGITSLPRHIVKNKYKFNFYKFLKKMFLDHYE
jgi:hypothetical protein